MRWFSVSLCFLLAANAFAEDRGFLVGGGFEVDEEGGLRGGLVAGLELGESTWLSGAASTGSSELGNGDTTDLLYTDIDLDHYFDPIGVRIGAAYWGDPDLLDSVDWRVSAYVRNERIFFGVNYEHRDFDFTIPPADFFAGREFEFTGEGLGATLRLPLGEKASISFDGMKYDYSVNFEPNDAVVAARLLTATRLSLINELIDGRLGVGLGIDVGEHRWELDYATWESALGSIQTDSFTLRFIMPATDRLDLEFSLGFDETEFGDSVYYASVYGYFFGVL
ncbi:MAG: hypothetical protein AAF351_13960 [Pseudomonadota bacterium]